MRVQKISIENKPVQGIKKTNTSKQKHEIQTNYSKIPQMGLVSFGNRMESINALLGEARKVCITGYEYGLLSWERNTTKPTPARIDEIAKKLGDLSVLSNAQSKSVAIIDAVQKLRAGGTEGLSDFHRGLVRVWGKNVDNATKFPVEFVREQSELTVHSSTAWEKARENNDFALFEPFLTQMFLSARKGANFINPNKPPHDVLLEHLGYTAPQIDEIFSGLRQDLVPLIKPISEKSKINPEILERPASIAQLQEFALDLARDMGLDTSKTRIGKTAHSFMSELDSPKEIGIAIEQPEGKNTTIADCIDVITSFTHETGHGLVELGGDEKLYRTGLTGASLGIHESQSRLWENIVGRSKGFWQHYFPKLQQKVEGFRAISFDDFYQAVNQVQPSFIRTQADEVTYNLHVMLRHEIERELLKPGLSDEEVAKLVKRLPETWGNKMEEYLGVRPKTDSDGVLQDVHWSEGLIGYFPSYSIGNLASAQIMNAVRKEIPDIDARIAQGDLKTLHMWLKEKMYKNGQIYEPNEILKRATGESLNPRYFVEYLKAKYLG